MITIIGINDYIVTGKSIVSGVFDMSDGSQISAYDLFIKGTQLKGLDLAYIKKNSRKVKHKTAMQIMREAL